MVSEEGHILRVLSESIENMKTTIKNFGIVDIPVSLADQINEEFHTSGVVNFFTNQANRITLESYEEVFQKDSEKTFTSTMYTLICWI